MIAEIWRLIPRTFRDPANVALVLSFLLVGFALSLIVWNVSRGLDLTDESWIIALLSENKVTAGEPWGFQHIAQPLWVLLGGSVIGGRIGRILLYQGAIVLATWAISRFGMACGVHQTRRSVAIVFVAAQAAALNGWAYWPRTFGYNEFAAFFVTAGVSLVLVLTASFLLHGTLSLRRRVVSASALGVVAALLILTKATSGLSLALGVVVVLAVLPGALSLLGAFAAAGIVTGGLAWLLGFPMQNYVSAVFRMATDPIYAASFARPPGMLQANLNDLFVTAIHFLPALLTIVALVGVAVVGTRLEIPRLALNITTMGLLGMYATAVWSFDTSVGLLQKTSTLGLQLGVFALGALLAWRWSTPAGDPSLSRRTIVTVLAVLAIFATPFISSIGTNGQLTYHITLNHTLWGAVSGLAVVALLSAIGDNPVRRAIAAGAVVVVAFLGMRGVFIDRDSPYRNVAYAQQTESFTSANPLFAGLKLPRETANAFEDLERIGEGFAATPVIAPTSPGALLVFNGTSFASPWTERFWPGSYGTIAARCDRVGSPDALVVIQPSSVTTDTDDYSLMTEALLRGCGIVFPEDFDLVESTRPDVDGQRYTVWSLRSNP